MVIFIAVGAESPCRTARILCRFTANTGGWRGMGRGSRPRAIGSRIDEHRPRGRGASAWPVAPPSASIPGQSMKWCKGPWLIRDRRHLSEGRHRAARIIGHQPNIQAGVEGIPELVSRGLHRRQDGRIGAEF